MSSYTRGSKTISTAPVRHSNVYKKRDSSSQQVRKRQHRTEKTIDKNEAIIVRKSTADNTFASECNLTSWECYNVFLKGLVDELINLGASKKIRVVAFQLWALYLQWSDIAFISKKDEELPALSLGFRNKDGRALFDVLNFRKKVFEDPACCENFRFIKRCSRNDASSSLRIPSKKQKISVEKNEEASLENEPNSLDVMSLESTKRRNPKRIKLKPVSEETLKEIKHYNKEHSSTVRKRLLSNWKARRLMFDRRQGISGKKASNIPVTTVTLITILRVALQMVGDEIFLGDILRWICEGRLSVNQPKKFVSTLDWFVINDLMKVRRTAFQLDIRNFTNNLQLSKLRPPNLFKLTMRYCEELCLPSKLFSSMLKFMSSTSDQSRCYHTFNQQYKFSLFKKEKISDEFTEYVLKLIVDSKVKMRYSRYNFRIFPDYECRLMAFILFTFKLIFSLDDFTEYQLSKFVDAIDEIKATDSTANVPKLFSWRNWMRYMECRKAVLSRYNVPINQISYDNGTYHENIFQNYWRNVKPTYEATDKTIGPFLLSSLNDVCCDFSPAEVHKKEINNFDSSISPTSSKPLMEHIMKNHSNLLSRRQRKLLSENFSSYSLKYAMKTKRLLRIAKRFDLNVVLCDSVEYVNKEINLRPEFTMLALSKTTLPRCDILVAVCIEDNEATETMETEAEVVNMDVSNRQYKFRPHHQDENTSLRIPQPSYYWNFHECYKRMTVEEFDMCAKNNFSSSFRWLLRECASILRADAKDLYFELIFVEIVLHGLYRPFTEKKSSMRIYMKEW